jgi:hypothetical protein
MAKETLGKQRRKRKGGRKYIWSEEIGATIRREKKSYLTAFGTKKP